MFIEQESISLREAGLKFNIPDKSIISKWKKDFCTFGLEGLESKAR